MLEFHRSRRSGSTTLILSGWFDAFTFCDFLRHFAKFVSRRRGPGKVVLLCDNLRSHLSVEATEICEANDIVLLCLPANSTDKIQPLDVGLFRHMKAVWKNMLRHYGTENPEMRALAKPEFPKMLRELMEKMEPKQKLVNAFRKCGLVPIDPTQVMEKIPHRLATEEIAQHVDQQLLKNLEVRRFGDPSKKKKPRGKGVPVGASISAAKDSSSEEEEEDVDDIIDGHRGKKNKEVSVSESEESETDSLPDLTATGTGTATLPAGTLVAACYEGEIFIAEVTESQRGLMEGYTRLSYTAPRGINVFAWPDVKDIMPTLNEDILVKKIVVEPFNSRGFIKMTKKDYDHAKTLMVVVYIFSKLKISYRYF